MWRMLSVPGTLFVVILAGCSSVTRSFEPPSSTTTTPPTPITSVSPGPAVGATSGRFTVSANNATARAGQTATLLPNGSVLVAGGGQLDIDDLLEPISSIEILSPSGQVMSAGNLSTSREFHTATLLQNGKVLITGGNASSGNFLPATASAEIYDSATGQSMPTGDMSVARTGHTASLLPDGRVLIFGGTSLGTPSAEIYDPAKGTFAPAATPSFSRSGHTATVLPLGKVLFVGGRDSSGALATAEIYDPSTNTFTVVGSMAEQRTHHTATLLPNGKVIVAGGGVAPALGAEADLSLSPQMVVDSPSQTVELFDPQTGTFTSAGTMKTARSSHTATSLADGTVLLYGGSHAYSNSDGYTSDDTAEIYDPTTGVFNNAGAGNTGKFWHTATLLPDGTVVFVGGIDRDLTLNVVEVFK